MGNIDSKALFPFRLGVTDIEAVWVDPNRAEIGYAKIFGTTTYTIVWTIRIICVTTRNVLCTISNASVII